nr:cox cluster protein [Halobaculum sp. SYNS20]
MVIVLYLVLTAVGGVAGVLVATFVDDLSAPALYAVIPLPATTLGFGVYGAVTIATVLGIPLALVVYVSRRIDDPNAVDE